MNLTLIFSFLKTLSYNVSYLYYLHSGAFMLASILISVIVIYIYLYFKYNKDNKHINIDYSITNFFIPEYGFGKCLGIYDKNTVNNRVLQDWYTFYLKFVPPYAIPVVNFFFISFFPKPKNIQYLYRESDYMVAILQKDSYTYLVFADSCEHSFELDDGNEELWYYIPSTRRIYTAGFLGFIPYYLNIPLFLPKGGGVWVPGPTSYMGLFYYKIIGYRFSSGGKPLLSRINGKGKLEIFIRDDLNKKI